MPDDDFIALFFNDRGRDFFQFSEQVIGNARPRKRDIGIFQRIGHAPDAVMVFHEQVFLLHKGARGFLWRCKIIADHLEYIRKRWQRKHDHHQAADAGRGLNPVGRVFQVAQEVTVKQRLADFLQADAGIDFTGRLVGHQAREEFDVRGRYFHVDHEVSAREGKQQGDVLRFEQDRVEHQIALAVMQDRHDERKFAIAVDALADDIRALVTVEQARKHLELVIRLDRDITEHQPQPRFDERDITVNVGKRACELEVRDDALERILQAIPGRIIDAVSRRDFVVFKIGCRDSRPHENEIVMKIRAVEDLAAHGIEENLGQFRLFMIDQ